MQTHIPKPVIDAHVHIERGPYTESWIDAFVSQAQAAGIDELHLLEHSFRFQEFHDIYKPIEAHPDAGAYQQAWLASRCTMHLGDYKRLVSYIRKKHYPISVKYGLEVCYFPESENEIAALLSDFDWDFLTGSIHWIDGFGFDHRENIPLWEQVNVNELYRRYYTLMIHAVNSGIFDIIAHPDSIKCFGFLPSIDLVPLYENLAQAAVKQHAMLEFSNGLYINYDYPELGMNRTMLAIMQRNHVNLITASDAHKPGDTGRYIRQAVNIIDASKYT